jgi:hypothetical protein
MPTLCHIYAMTVAGTCPGMVLPETRPQTVVYRANRSRAGDLLLAKAVWGLVGGVGRARMPIEQGFSCSLAIAGGGCFPRLLNLCLISPGKRLAMMGEDELAGLLDLRVH